MAGKKGSKPKDAGTQSNMLTDTPEGEDAPKVPSDPKSDAPLEFCLDKEMDFPFGEGQFPLDPKEFKIKVRSYSPDANIGGGKFCVPYGLQWKFATITVYHASNTRVPIVPSRANCYMHWPANETELPKGKLVDLDFAETLSMQNRGISGMYLIIDGYDPAYGESYTQKAESQKFVRSTS